MVQFWNEAYNLHSQFAEYYGGENMVWALVDLGLSMFVGEVDADHIENKTKCPSMKTPNCQPNLHYNFHLICSTWHVRFFWLACHNDLFDSHLEDTLSPLDGVTTSIDHIPFVLETKLQSIFSHVGVPCKSEMWPLVAVLPSPTDGAYQTFGAQIPMSSHGILQ